MKWYTAEEQHNVDNWGPGDATALAAKHGMDLRGHCLFWDRENWIHEWLKPLRGADLEAAVLKRAESAATHYKGRVSCWDAFNEILDGGYFEEHVPGIYERVFKMVNEIDPDAALFCNEYSILGGGEKTGTYIDLMKSFQDRGIPLGGIGIQEHACERITTACATADRIAPKEIERMHHARLTVEDTWKDLDRLSEAIQLPIHLTEISCKFDDEEVRGVGLETLLRCAFAHPAVESFMLWGFWEGNWLGKPASLSAKIGS